VGSHDCVGEVAGLVDTESMAGGRGRARAREVSDWGGAAGRRRVGAGAPGRRRRGALAAPMAGSGATFLGTARAGCGPGGGRARQRAAAGRPARVGEREPMAVREREATDGWEGERGREALVPCRSEETPTLE
jgi:hypothetical protein